jgi:hypothetical protein
MYCPNVSDAKRVGSQPKGNGMKIIAVAVLVLLAYVSGVVPLDAADICKECREFQKVCLQAHSKAACKSEYDICMKHCRQK